MSQPDRQRQSKIDQTSAIFLNRQRFVSVLVVASGLRADRICGSSASANQPETAGKVRTSMINRSEQAASFVRALSYAGGLFGGLRVALRSLRRVPSFWATIALTLALGIGMNTAIFSVVRSVVLRPLMNRDEGRLSYNRGGSVLKCLSHYWGSVHRDLSPHPRYQ